jgi:hypothetical protein
MKGGALMGGAIGGRRDGGTVAIFANQLLKFERRTHAFAAAAGRRAGARVERTERRVVRATAARG